MSLIKKLIANATAEGRYLSSIELEQIGRFIIDSDRRLRLARTLTASRDLIVKQAATQLFDQQPGLVSPGGNAYGKDMTATCLRDMDSYLRLITYSVVADELVPIQEIGLIGVRRMYHALGTPINAVAESIRAMKVVTNTLMPADEASEVRIYFDYLIFALQ